MGPQYLLNGLRILNKIRKRLRTLHYDHPVWFFLIVLLSLFIGITIIAIVSELSGFGKIIPKTSLIDVHVTILSIIIALTLLSIQINTEKYSFRVVESFKNLFEIWMIFGIYSLAIFFDLITLANPCYPNRNIFGIFSIFSIVCVFPYYWVMLVFMRPENMMDRQSKKISSDLDDNFNTLFSMLEILQISMKNKEITILNSVLHSIETITINDSNEKIWKQLQERLKDKEKHKDVLERLAELRVILDCIKNENVNPRYSRFETHINSLYQFFSLNYDYSIEWV